VSGRWGEGERGRWEIKGTFVYLIVSLLKKYYENH